MKGIRTFIGIFPPPHIQSAIADILSPLKPNTPAVRWERQEKFHITMKFLGDVSAGQIGPLETSLFEAGKSIQQFDILLARIGCFPPSHSPKIVWVGSGEDTIVPLTECFTIVERKCVSAGFKKEERPFHPHITVGRVKGKVSENLIKKIENTTFEPLQFLCTELLIMKSDLSPSGSAYSQLSSIPLKQ